MSAATSAVWFSKHRRFMIILIVAAGALRAADDVYVVVKADALTFVNGKPTPDDPTNADWRHWRAHQAMMPYVALDGAGEVFWEDGHNQGGQRDLAQVTIAVHAPAGKPIVGRLFLAKPDLSGMEAFAFTIAADHVAKREEFERVMRAYYESCAQSGSPGGAWFRHQQRVLDGKAGPNVDVSDGNRARPERDTEFDDTLDLFSGNRALSENLQLDRELNVQTFEAAPPENQPKAGEASIVIATGDTLTSIARSRGTSVNWIITRNDLREGLPAVGTSLIVPRMAGDPPLVAVKPPPGVPSVAVAGLEGITVKEFDWAPLVKDLKPATDPLAASIPADQHAIFFSSFAAMTAVMDEVDAAGTPILHLFESRSEDARTKERYQQQLCLEMSDLARRFGPQIVSSVAFTGSDPYLRSGSDVAILFEAKQPELLLTFLVSKQAAAKSGKAKAVKGEVGGIAYTGVVADDRSVSVYLASLGANRVVVTNSLAQLGQLSAVAKGTVPALIASPEYVFFRDRYQLGGEEGGLVVLTDATIRRWCSPRWRIGDSRRTRAAAVLAELQAEHADDIVKGEAGGNPALVAGGLGTLSLSASGVLSSIYGSLDFMTPVAELPIEQVTKAEADAYARFREHYQSNWHAYFDPIALSFTVRPTGLAADLTVMPLIAGSEYHEMISLVGNAKIPPAAGDAHADAIVHFAMAIDLDSRMGKEAGGFLRGMNPKFEINPLSWFGGALSLYLDPDPVLDEMAKEENGEKFMQKNFYRMPLALQVEVKDGFKLTAFLATMRGFIEQSSPGMVTWETKTWNDQPYVKVSPSDEMAQEQHDLAHAALYYAVSPSALVLTLNEGVLKHALERRAARKQAKADGKPLPEVQPWLGESVAVHLGTAFFGLLKPLGHLWEADQQEIMRSVAWSNLPILNEWKRRYPDQDPLAVHEKLWKVRLVSPGGGTFVWNEKFHTMESTIFGCPGAPKDGPLLPAAFANLSAGNFGISFENQGVRVRAALVRQTKP